MALKQSATIALRPSRVWLAAITAAAMLAAGCNHRRQSLRPVFTSPAAVSTPCTNCGSGSSTRAIISGPTVTSPGSSSRSLSSEPLIDDASTPAGTESSVPPLDPTTGSSRDSLKNPLPEQPPKASIGGEPELDAFPSKSTTPRRPSGSAPAGIGGMAPALQGPDSAPSASLSRNGLRTASATQPMRRGNTQERLRPFLEDSDDNELFYPNKADRPWKFIVLHHSANPEGSLDRIDREHRKVLGYDGCGYHFVIGNGTGSGDGQIQVARRWVNQKHGVHCRNAKSAEIDEYGIGICLVGDLDKVPPTPRQVAAAKSLIAYLSARYGVSAERVETHAHLAATPTVCPGRHFPTATFVALGPESAQPIASSAVPTSWRAVRRSGSELR